MKFPYHVFHNGISYAPNTEVPVGVEEKKAVVEEKKEEHVIERAEEPAKEVQKPTYTKTEVNRMSTADLRRLGADLGIADAEKKSGADLKKEIIAKIG